jgi:hypothetical protein
MVLASSEDTILQAAASAVANDQRERFPGSHHLPFASALLSIISSEIVCCFAFTPFPTLSGSQLNQCEVKMLSRLISVCTEKVTQYDRVAVLKSAPAVLKDLGTI